MSGRLRIAIHGSGRMGTAVREVAISRGHQVVGTYDRRNPLPESLDADAIVDFSTAGAMDAVVGAACRSSCLLVTGTTGWNDRMAEIRARIEAEGTGCVHASNFSIGANVLFRLAADAARHFSSLEGYAAGIEERHHARKKDAPSGTALTLARSVREGSASVFDPSIAASRVGEEFGLHTLFFDSADDVLELVHRARGRSGFARGAVIAAERAQGRTGWIDFSELLFGGEGSQREEKLANGA